MSTDEFRASTELDDEGAYRAVVADLNDLTLRVTGTELEDGDWDGIDIDLESLNPREDAVVELIDGDEVVARLIQPPAEKE